MIIGDKVMGHKVFFFPIDKHLRSTIGAPKKKKYNW
jgi:hypothetical protein